MTWEILILTQPSRTQFLAQLSVLLQLQGLPGVTVLVRHFDPVLSLGENRQKLRELATAEYISFIDDDDFIDPRMLPLVLNALENKPDQVAFDVKIYRNNEYWGIAHNSVKFGQWCETAGPEWWRDISHILPMRRELALEVPMSGGIGEDHRWADAMRGRVKTEERIDHSLYYYLWREPKDDAKDVLARKRLELWESLKAR